MQNDLHIIDINSHTQMCICYKQIKVYAVWNEGDRSNISQISRIQSFYSLEPTQNGSKQTN